MNASVGGDVAQVGLDLEVLMVRDKVGLINLGSRLGVCPRG